VAKGFTGVQPFRYDGREIVACEPADAHRAHGWQPLIGGRLIIVNGHALRYVRKADAQAALAAATKRRAKPTRNYRLGKPMEKKS
jgi:hypothetical protein